MKKSTLEKYHKVKSDRTASTLSLHIPYVGMCDNARGRTPVRPWGGGAVESGPSAAAFHSITGPQYLILRALP